MTVQEQKKAPISRGLTLTLHLHLQRNKIGHPREKAGHIDHSRSEQIDHHRIDC